MESSNQALARMESERQRETLLREEGFAREDHADLAMDDELDDEYEMSPDMGRVLHLMSLLDMLDGPSLEPQPESRPAPSIVNR